MATARVERRLAAILAADVVGYATLMERDEDGTLARLMAHRREFIEPLISEQHGRLVKLMGDGLLAEFPSVVDAIRCAVLLQQGMAEREAKMAAARRIRIRIGINVGDIICEADGDLYGDGVNVAARLEQLAEAGGVMVSGTVYDQLHGKLGYTLEFAGDQKVKNIERLVRAYRLRLDGKEASFRQSFHLPRYSTLPVITVLVVLVVLSAAVWHFWPGQSPAERPAIAVLPFSNLGGDEATGRLADGITEDVIADLARFRGLDVIARNSTETYKGRPVDVRKVGKDLGVGYVLEGSIQRQGDQIRTTAQLIDARTGAHVWTERWDRPARDLFAVQAEVAERVGAALGTPLGLGVVGANERERARRRSPANLGAYEHYLLAAEAKARRTPESIRQGMEHVERAIALDATLARAYVLRGWLHFFTFSNGTADYHTAMQAAEADFSGAVSLDPYDAEAHAALANYYSFVGRLAESEAEIRAALAASPADGHVLILAANTLPRLGHPEEAAGYADKALRLDPSMAPANLIGIKDAYYFARRFEDALHVISRIPPNARSRGTLLLEAASLAMLGRPRHEVEQATAAVLTHDLEVSVELLLNQDYAFARQQERDLFVDGLRKAGLPACAKSYDLVKAAKPVRLPECVAERADAAIAAPPAGGGVRARP